MKRWILAAIAAVSLALAPVGLEAKGGGHSGRHSRSGSHKSKGSSEKSGKKAASCTSCARDKHGRIKRDPKQRAAFAKSTGYPHGRKGYVVDHIIPLECGGADVPSNMQWQTKEAAALKDRTEVRCRQWELTSSSKRSQKGGDGQERRGYAQPRCRRLDSDQALGKIHREPRLFSTA